MENLKQHFIISVILYSIIYLIKSFILFELTNPFWWILSLPQYTSGERAGVLSIIIFFQIFVHILKIGIFSKNKS